MSQVRLYLDEDAMRKSLVFGLRARKVDVVTASDAERINRSDEDHLANAAESGHVLFTFNVADYCILHQGWVSRGRPHAGIIVSLQQRYSTGEELRRLMRLMGSVTAEKMRNRIESLSSWS